MDNKIGTNLDVKIENHEEVIKKLDEGIKTGFKVSGIKVNNILITKNSKNKNILVFCLNTEGWFNNETVVFSIKNQDISPYRLYRALREKILRFAQQERRDQKALDRIFGKGDLE